MSDICYRRAYTASDTCKIIDAAESAGVDKMHVTHDGRDFVVFLIATNVEQRAAFNAACNELAV